MRKVVCSLLLVLSIIIMLSGLTMSYFFGKSNDVLIPFTTGILEMEITNLPEDTDNWIPGKDNAKELEWTFKNVGSQPAWLRVKVEGKWDNVDLADIAQCEHITEGWDWDNDNGFYVYKNSINSNETANIKFLSWLDMDINNYNELYNSAKYTITMTLEASQETW